MLISQQARAGIPVNHDFHPERVPNHQEWSSYSTTVTLSSSERQEHMFLLKRPDHMRCGHASIPRFPTLVGMLYLSAFRFSPPFKNRCAKYKERRVDVLALCVTKE